MRPRPRPPYCNRCGAMLTERDVRSGRGQCQACSNIARDERLHEGTYMVTHMRNGLIRVECHHKGCDWHYDTESPEWAALAKEDHAGKTGHKGRIR